MKKAILPVLFLFFSIQISAQFADRITELIDNDLKQYATPLATFTGSYLNSAGYYSANVPSFFGVKIGLVGMMVLVPDDQTSYTLSSGEKTATFFGEKGAAVPGSEGYLVYPPGINVTSIPTGIPQIAVSTLGTEVMLRYIPTLDLDDVETGLFGFGLKHSISQYIPLLPVDIAVQFLYTSVSIENKAEDFDLSNTNTAFNVHASRGFGLVTLYGGLQYESLQNGYKLHIYRLLSFRTPDEKVKLSLDGDNNFRFTLGAALKLAVLVINADINLGSQTVFVAGLNFEL